MKYLLGVLLFFISTSAMAYSTNCVILDGKAYGYASSENYKSLTISGTVTFIFYDNNWDELDRDSSYEYEYIYNDTELINTESAHRRATKCFFDISKAVKNQGDRRREAPSEYKIFVFCEISGAKASGYVKTPKYKRVVLGGKVTFYFYNNRGDEIDRDSTYASANIYNDTELVETERAPSGAHSCVFDISQAIK